MPPQETSPATVVPEAPPTPTEAVPAPETGPQGPLPFSKTDDRQENQVAQTSTSTACILLFSERTRARVH